LKQYLLSATPRKEGREKTHPMIKGPNPAERSAINVYLTPASLNAAICCGERVTPGGGPLIISSIDYFDD
jgi:hypothetical protein